MDDSFESFFLTATGFTPYPYQVAHAGNPVRDAILDIPTAAGKTAAAVLAWMWRRQIDPVNTPRRLVYCLPMRSLVEQTQENVQKWNAAAGLDLPVYVLMGGDVDEDWELRPEQPAILIGTQDMLLSRALNRGYGMSRYRWPAHFALLNNDAVWVFDEIQLMGAGLPSSSQLAAFRRSFGTFGPCPSVWMSATVSLSDLETVDFAPMLRETPHLTLTDRDLSDRRLRLRLQASKALSKAPTTCRTPKGLAEFAASKHRPGTQTIIVVNRVERARDVFAALDGHPKGADAPELLLLHSRFRPNERRAWQQRLRERPAGAGRVIVSTQVIEAGMDISSSLLLTDLAPYPSLVQRFGRSNRAGEDEQTAIYWIDRPLTERSAKLADLGELDEKQMDDIALPYSWPDLEEAAKVLIGLESASPAGLPPVAPARSHHHTLRRRDLIDLFDTSRDLSGFDVDISRFVRGGDEHDMLIAWRELGDGPPVRTEPAPGPDELCPVPVNEVRAFLKNTPKGRRRRVGWFWDALDGEWRPVTTDSMGDVLRPGLVLLFDCGAGGYEPHRGWDPASASPVPAIVVTAEPGESMGEDRRSRQRYRQTLVAHSREVRDTLDEIVAALGNVGLGACLDDLRFAALHHDVGKAHHIFQTTVRGADDSLPLLAKSESNRRHSRPHFRHELASALSLIVMGAPDLVAYLAAAHHGRIRLSIRALPGEEQPRDSEARFARGIWDGERLPELALDGLVVPEISLNLEPMLLGAGPAGASWVERAVALRDRFGPFRLAFLEALIVAADARASAAPKEVLR